MIAIPVLLAAAALAVMAVMVLDIRDRDRASDACSRLAGISRRLHESLAASAHAGEGGGGEPELPAPGVHALNGGQVRPAGELHHDFPGPNVPTLSAEPDSAPASGHDRAGEPAEDMTALGRYQRAYHEALGMTEGEAQLLWRKNNPAACDTGQWAAILAEDVA